MSNNLPIVTRDSALARHPTYDDLQSILPMMEEASVFPRRTLYASTAFADPLHVRMETIPRNLWKKLFDNQEGSFLQDVLAEQLAPHNQGQTRYCWAHACVRTLEALRVWQGQQPCLLSAESIAVPITGGRNRGGTCDEAIPQLREYGACRQELWPLNDLNERHAEPSWKVDRLRFRLLRWIETKSWDEQMTLAFKRIPLAIGLGWWGHMPCQLGPARLPNGELGIVIDNSWGPNWGENGRGVLDEEHGTADLGAFAPIVETWSEP